MQKQSDLKAEQDVPLQLQLADDPGLGKLGVALGVPVKQNPVAQLLGAAALTA
jgi:hypothetical protein